MPFARFDGRKEGFDEEDLTQSICVYEVFHTLKVKLFEFLPHRNTPIVDQIVKFVKV